MGYATNALAWYVLRAGAQALDAWGQGILGEAWRLTAAGYCAQCQFIDGC